MGYRGKVEERARARRLRAEGWRYDEIVAELGVARSSVSRWCRDVEIPPEKRRRRRPPRRRAPNRLQRAKAAEIAAADAEGRERLAALSEQAFLAAGAALYAGDGSKTDGGVGFANSNPDMVGFFCRWLRHFLDIDESRIRVRLYLHQGLDLDAAEHFWSEVTAVPRDQFRKAYRAVPDTTIRHNKHEHGCCHVTYSCSRTHRRIMGLVRALVHSPDLPG